MTKTIERRALEWCLGDNTGRSSKAVARQMLGLPQHGTFCHPLDGSDLGRCIELLDAVQEWRERILEMGAVSPMWKVLAEHWAELEAMHRAGDPGLYERMKELTTRHEDATGRVIRLGNSASVVFGR